MYVHFTACLGSILSRFTIEVWSFSVDIFINQYRYSGQKRNYQYIYFTDLLTTHQCFLPFHRTEVSWICIRNLPNFGSVLGIFSYLGRSFRFSRRNSLSRVWLILQVNKFTVDDIFISHEGPTEHFFPQGSWRLGQFPARLCNDAIDNIESWLKWFFLVRHWFIIEQFLIIFSLIVSFF